MSCSRVNDGAHYRLSGMVSIRQRVRCPGDALDARQNIQHHDEHKRSLIALALLFFPFFHHTTTRHASLPHTITKMNGNTPSASTVPAALVYTHCLLSSALTPVCRATPGLSEKISALRRPQAIDVFYSCTQQEWDALCQKTLVDQTRASATNKLVRLSQAAVRHETIKGEPALVKCTACSDFGGPCYLKAHSTAKTCGYCTYNKKSKCSMYPSLVWHVLENGTDRDRLQMLSALLLVPTTTMLPTPQSLPSINPVPATLVSALSSLQSMSPVSSVPTTLLSALLLPPSLISVPSHQPIWNGCCPSMRQRWLV